MSQPTATELVWQVTEYRLHVGDLSARVYPAPGKGWRWTVHQQGPSGWVEADRGSGDTPEEAMGLAQGAVQRINRK